MGWKWGGFFPDVLWITSSYFLCSLLGVKLYTFSFLIVKKQWNEKRIELTSRKAKYLLSGKTKYTAFTLFCFQFSSSYSGVLGVLFCVATFLGANMKMNVSIRKVKQMPYKEEASKSNTGWCVIISEKGKETL